MAKHDHGSLRALSCRSVDQEERAVGIPFAGHDEKLGRRRLKRIPRILEAVNEPGDLNCPIVRQDRLDELAIDPRVECDEGSYPAAHLMLPTRRCTSRSAMTGLTPKSKD